MTFFSTDGLARTATRHPWITLTLWAALLAGALFGASQLRLDGEQEIRGADSLKAKAILADRLRGPDPATETVIVQSTDGATVDSAAFEQKVAGLAAALRALEGSVMEVATYYDGQDAALVSPDRTATILPVVLTGTLKTADGTVVPVLDAVAAARGEGFSVLIAGDGSIGRELDERFERDLKMAEVIGLPAALIVLVVVFGAAVSAGVPVLLALLGILVATGITGVISRIMTLDNLVMNMITMIGLAVGIDYTLFILERFREERRGGLEKVDAIVHAGATASRAVLFSGLTVIIALAGLLIVPATVFQGMAIGSITVVVAAVLAALTLLPAVLSLLGDRVNWLSLPGRKQKRTVTGERGGFFGWTTALVMRHPVISVMSSAGLLIALAVPYLKITVTSPGLADMPQDMQVIQAFNVLERDFSAGRLAPVEIVFDGEVSSLGVAVGVARLREQIKSDSAFSGLSTLELNAAGDAAYLAAYLQGDGMGDESYAAVRRLKDDYVPAAFGSAPVQVYVGGGTASTIEYIDTMKHYLPIMIVFVLTLSFLLLMVVFRSIVIPVKAIIMNLLSVGAAYGLLVLVFQEGVGAGLLGFQQTTGIAAFLPVFLFAVLFGLSMDYHVFLLSRIQERFRETGDNRGSVAYGLRSTAAIITGAAAIMIAVFGGFAVGDMVELQQTGFGLAAAVFLDATLVRSVLVPASMELLGDLNWYFPRWLEWLPKIEVERALRAGKALERQGKSDWAPAVGGGK